MERVIKGLEKCKRYECDDCTEKGASQAPWDCPAYDNFVDSALALLKEQEPVEPKEEPHKIVCGICGEKLAEICGDVDIVWNDDAKYSKFCPECGRKVKWDETI